MPFTARTAFRLVLLAPTAALAIACDHGSVARDRTLVIALAADPSHLFPPTLAETPGFTVADQILERLAEPASALDISNDAPFHPRLADRWSWSADSLSIAFHVAPRATWHDGHPVTSRDVRFTFDLYSDPEVNAPAASLLGDIDSVTTRGDRVAVFWFHRRHGRQLFDATYQMRIVPEHLLRRADRRTLHASTFAHAPVGSGPFRFRRWVRGQVVELDENPFYYGERARVNRLLFVIAPDPRTAVARAAAGDVDVLAFLRAGDASAARAAKLCVRQWPSLSMGTIVLNVRDRRAPERPHPLFGDAGVRRALALAIDRHAIAESVFGIAASPAAGPVPAALLRETAPAMPRFDPAAARALVAARDEPRSPLVFELLVPSRAAATRVGVLVQEQLRRVGVGVALEAVDAATLAARLERRDFDAALVSLDFDPDPLSARQLWGADTARGQLGLGGYRNPRITALFDSAAAAPSRHRLARLWTALVDDAPVVWLYDIANVAATRRGVRPTGIRADAWWSDLAHWNRTPLECPAS